MRIGIIIDGQVKARHSGCDCYITFGKRIKFRAPTVHVDEKFNISLHNFPKVPEGLSDRYYRIIKEHIRRDYSYAYSYICYSFGGQYLVFFPVSNAPLYEIYPSAHWRRHYFKVATALAIPIFFLQKGVIDGPDDLIETMGFSASSCEALKIKPYEWILTPLTLGFAYSEHKLEHSLILNEIKDIRGIAHAFLSFMLWHKSEPLIQTVREFLDKVHAFAQKA